MTAPVVGADIGGTKMLLTARGPDGRALESVRVDTGADATAADLERHIGTFLTRLPAPPRAVGIAVPGLVQDGRVVLSDVLPGLNGWDPPSFGGDGVPQVIVNDLRAALAGEIDHLPPDSTVAVVLAGTGIAMAYRIDGHTARGACGWAGEIGYLPVHTASGIRHLDQVAGGAAIVESTGLTPDRIHAALADGDPEVTKAVRTAGEAFGTALVTVIQTLNPQEVVLAGGTLGYTGYLDEALGTAERYALPEMWKACVVRRAADEPNIVVNGVLRLAAEAAGDTL